VFVSERGSPFTTAGFARMIERAAAGAELEVRAHPHTLRHACGYALANKGHDTRAIQGWLGHRSITSTAVYTALAPNRGFAFGAPRARQARVIDQSAAFDHDNYLILMIDYRLPSTARDGGDGPLSRP
jgi:integrase